MDIIIHNYSSGISDSQYKSIFSLLNKIKMQTQEAVDKVNAQTAQLEKIAGEVTAIKDALAAAIAAGDTVPAALVAAIEASGLQIQIVDDLNPDAAPTV